ncbi:MAG: M23 family metallopeptidase, partial [Ruminococcaceae bacterium]|nr:M23 family metallopeptidase [Oscillospiraceae bacterium]
INAEPLIPIYTMPVASGMPVKGFSGGELVKNETMNDWRTHDGIDIETTEGAEVYAVYSGEILRAGEDPLWGYVVELKVDTGYTAVYANLTSDIRVKAGDRVSQGDLLGFVGTTAILENAEPPHLHFEVKSGEKYIDPASFY